MKRNFLWAVITAFMMLPLFSNAQQKPFKLGLQIAPGLGWLTPDESTGYESEGAGFGLSWSFVCDFALTENYFLSTGVNYLSNNGKLRYIDVKEVDNITAPVPVLRKYNLKYVEVPLSLKMKTNQFGAMKYFGQIGVGPAINVSAKGKDNYGPVVEDLNIKEDINFFQIGLLFGGGTEFYIDKSTAITGSLLFRKGFTDVLGRVNTVYNPDIKEKATPFTFQFCIGVIF
ncbi:MAG: hypothetical protein CSA95_06820 [Bacteroidetes bacterium]|nr:MAG: hypothetical protein CSA95_06820 [Bacteroidota bacterium]PIE88505.1 MAG: hypothetical protein CSA04_01545 [Bacteroidota bacterium]